MDSYFDLEEARKSWSDAEIAVKLSQDHEYNLAKAKADGHNDTEIAEYLANMPMPLRIRSPREEVVPEWGIKHPNLYGTYGAVKEVWEKGGKQSLEALGLAAGGLGGSAVGPAGTVAGAGLGYGIAKNVERSIQGVLDRLGGVSREERTLKKETRKTFRDIKTGMMFEMGGQIANVPIQKGLQTVLAPKSKYMTSSAELRAAEAEMTGIQPTAADVTHSKGLGLIESVIEKSPTGADIVNDFRFEKQLQPLMRERARLIAEVGPDEPINVLGRRIREQVDDYLTTQTNLKGERLEALRTDILSRLGTNASYKSVGLETKELLKHESIIAMNRARQAYLDVGAELGNSAFETPELSRVASEYLSQFKELPIQDPKMSRVLNWSVSQIPPELKAEIAAYPSEVRKQMMDDIGSTFIKNRTWRNLVDFDKQLGGLARAENPSMQMGVTPGTRFQTTPEGQIYGKLKDALRADMAAIAEQTGGNVLRKYEAAKALYSDLASVWKNKDLVRIAAQNPEDLVDAAFRANGTTEIKLLKEALGADGFFKLRQSFTNKIMGIGKFDTFDPKFLNSQLRKYGDEMLSHVYTQGDLQFLKEVAKDGIQLGKQKPGTQFLRTLAQSYPDTVVDSIIGAPETKLQSNTLLKNIGMLKAAVDKPTIQKLSVKLADKLFQLNQTKDYVSPLAFSRMVNKYSERVLKQFFPADKVAQLQRLARVAANITSAERMAGNPSGTGQTIITWSTARMMINQPTMGLATLITPKYLGKLYLSDFGLRWLTEGFTTPAIGAKGMELATKIALITGMQEEQ
jgi:hypothetical protein